VVARGVQPLGGDGEALSGLLLAASLVLQLRVGKKPGFFKKKTQPSGFYWVSWNFFGVSWGFSGFLGFLGFFCFFYKFVQNRQFLGFFQFQEYF
jgi:hypothetical protein